MTLGQGTEKSIQSIGKSAALLQQPRIIGLVACCTEKMQTEQAARDLYSSPWFRKARRWVEETCDGWAVLSAKHGLVLPETPLSPYNATLKILPAAERLRWALSTNAQIRLEFPGCGFVVVAGSDYRRCMFDLPFVAPLQGLGIGQQLAELDRLHAQHVAAQEASK